MRAPKTTSSVPKIRVRVSLLIVFNQPAPKYAKMEAETAVIPGARVLRGGHQRSGNDDGERGRDGGLVRQFEQGDERRHHHDSAADSA
jgi:hypothetical protein